MPVLGSSALTEFGVYDESWTASGPSPLLAVGVPLDVALPRAGDAERLGRDVLRDHATRSRVRVIAHGHGGDEGGVDARAHPAPDRRSVLVAAVVVGGDVAGADVGVLADVGVADVGQVRHLRAGP